MKHSVFISGIMAAVALIWYTPCDLNASAASEPSVQSGVESSSKRALILEYTVNNKTEVTLPLSGTVKCTVDWGDVSDIQEVTSPFPSHTYSDAGVYDVSITGTVTHLSSNTDKIAKLASRDTKLTAVKQWGMTGLNSMYYAFRCCSNLASIPTDKYGAFARVKSFECAFGYVDSLTEIPEGLFDYCSAVTTFASVFRESRALEKIPEGLFDYCEAATDFSEAFKGCTSLTGESPFATVKGTKVHLYERTEDLGFTLPTNTSECFSGATGLTDYADIPSSWRSVSKSLPGKALILEYTVKKNTEVTLPLAGKSLKCTVDWGDESDIQEVTSPFPSHTYSAAGVYDVSVTGTVTHIRSTSDKIATLASHDKKLTAVKQWGMTGLTDMSFALRCCDNLASIPTDDQGAFSNVTTFEYAFGYDPALKEIPAGLFDHCTSAVDYKHTFDQCTGLTLIPEHLFDNSTSVTDLTSTFTGCTEITAVPENLFCKCTKVKTVKDLFSDCKKLQSIPSNLFDGCNLIIDFSGAFRNCKKWVGESPYTVVDGVKVHLYERTSATGFAMPSSYAECFYLTVKLSDYDAIPASWRGDDL